MHDVCMLYVGGVDCVKGSKGNLWAGEVVSMTRVQSGFGILLKYSKNKTDRMIHNINR